jgi:hypothetical protein
MDYSKITLGELLSSDDETIRRHAVGILKKYQGKSFTVIPKVSRNKFEDVCSNCGEKPNLLANFIGKDGKKFSLCENCLDKSQ